MTETTDAAGMETDVKTEVKTEDTTAKTEMKIDDKKSEETEPTVATNDAKVKTETANGEKTETQESVNDTDASIKKEIVEVDSSLDDEIIQQIHYYFGDLNLLRDRFLQEQIKLDDGWVPLKVLLTFNRLKELSTDLTVILAALKKASKPLVEISEDGSKIRRSPAFPLPEMNETWRKSVIERTVYSKGFPLTGVSLDELIKFFKQFGLVDNVQKRTLIDRKNKEERKVIFKGSVFVTFKTIEDATKYLALESVKYGETELLRKAQQTYWDDKKVERAESWGRKKKDKDGKSSKQIELEKKNEEKVADCPRGCILHLAGFPEEPIERDSIREKVTELGGDVAFITYNRGDEEAYVRLQGNEEKPAIKLLETLSNKVVQIGESELTARVLEGDEETEFLRKSLEDRDKRRGSKRGRQGKNFRGRKRHGFGDSGPPAKKATTAE